LIKLIRFTHVNISTKSLHSCTLVSKHWCIVATPLLYAYPFPTHCKNAPNLALSYFKLIRTLLSCIPKSEIEQIILTLTNSFNPTFSYISFIRGLNFDLEILDRFNYYKKLWLSYFVLKI
jgi:hypothetical protein